MKDVNVIMDSFQELLQLHLDQQLLLLYHVLVLQEILYILQQLIVSVYPPVVLLMLIFLQLQDNANALLLITQLKILDLINH